VAVIGLRIVHSIAQAAPTVTVYGPRIVAPGGTAVVTGRAAPGAAVELQRQGASGWRTVARARVHSDGRYRVSARAPLNSQLVSLRTQAAHGISRPLRIQQRPVTLAAVGDINLADTPGQQIAANGPAWPWTNVGPTLKAADLTFGNLECVTSAQGTAVPKQYNFRGNPNSLGAVHAVGGLNILNLANNHTGDFGPAAMLDTIRFVGAHHMLAVGAGANAQAASAPVVVERLGLRIAVVGFSDIGPASFAATPSTPGTNWASVGGVQGDVAAARRVADIVIASFHWGIERQFTETDRQRQLAQAAFDAGASIVIGGHPHVLEPVVTHGTQLVAYSMGNFVFGAHSPGTSTTGILEVRITGAGATGWRMIPARIVNTRPELAGPVPGFSG
jgi:poly-gamma-glutamate synthesis protein (capsule biosynthesis protein)